MDFIPVNEPIISKEAKSNVLAALESGWISSSGPFVKKFEAAFAQHLGVKHAISVSSGTAAIHVALHTLNIGPGDEVIVPAFTMAGSWMPILHLGAKPVFVDCELETYNIDTSLIEHSITKKTKAIVAVHIYGHASDMDEINRIAQKYNLAVIEDSAEAFGGEYNNRKCGTMGTVGCFSFYANKIIATGEGGMIVTNNADIADRARKFRDLHHSETKRFIHDGAGHNFRFTNIQAALGLGELENIHKYLEKKQRMADLYTKNLNDLPGIKLPVTKPGVKNVFWMYGVLVDVKLFGFSRNQLKNELMNEGIETRDFFYSPEDQPVLKPYVGGQSYPNTKLISMQGLYLPSGLAITDEQIEKVISVIKELSNE